MMEILFRGKRVDNGEWIEGFYARLYDCKGNYSHRIYTGYAETDCGDFYPNFFEVIPETVGQYTGLTDKNGTKIFEGDIVEGEDYNEEDGYGIVTWDDGAFWVGNVCRTFCNNYNANELKVIGNIHDNPEFLKGGTR